MLTLVIKDIIIQKRTIILASVLSLIFPFIYFETIGHMSGACTVVIIVFMLLQGSVASSEISPHAEIMLLSLPLSRKTIVYSKYLSIGIYCIAAFILQLIAQSLVRILGLALPEISIKLSHILFAFAGITPLLGLYLPLYFKLGYSKTRLFLVIYFFGFVSLVVLFKWILTHVDQRISDMLTSIISFITHDTAGLWLIGAFGIIGMLASLCLSVFFYKRREF